MYARPLGASNQPLDFGVSGKLWRQALVMYDRQTRSLWSQRTSRAIAGPLAGRELEVLPSRLTTWGEWRADHPGTSVVIRPPSGGWLDRWADAWAGRDSGVFLVALGLVAGALGLSIGLIAFGRITTRSRSDTPDGPQ